MRKVLDYINGLCMFLMLLIVLIQIIARLIIKIPTSWSVEAGTILFVFVVFLGIASLTRLNIHLRVDFLYNLLNNKTKKIVDIVNSLLILIFLFFFSIGAFRNIRLNWNVSTPTIEWFKWGYVYLMVFISTLLNGFYYLVKTISDIKSIGE